MVALRIMLNEDAWTKSAVKREGNQTCEVGKHDTRSTGKSRVQLCMLETKSKTQQPEGAMEGESSPVEPWV